MWLARGRGWSLFRGSRRIPVNYVALERKDPNKAIELLKDASAIELGQSTSELTIFLCPAYVRGEAYLMLHDGKQRQRSFRNSSTIGNWW